MFVFTAFLLGFLMILDPCTLFTGIVSIAYIDKEIHNKRRIFSTGAMFVLGKLVTYTLLSYSLLWGMKSFSFETFITSGLGELVLAIFMIVCGVLLFVTGKIHHNHDHGVKKWLQAVDERSSNLWAFMLGIFFSIAFCPHRLFYFFTMLDMAITADSTLSYLLPVIFGLGTGIPILVVAWILSYSVISITSLQTAMQKYNKYIRYVCAVLFLCYGIYTTIHFFHHSHNDHCCTEEICDHH